MSNFDYANYTNISENEILNIIKNSSKNIEIECSLTFGIFINTKKYLDILSYMTNNYKYTQNITLDIIYSKENTNYILELSNIDLISDIITNYQNKQNNVIFLQLINLMKKYPEIKLKKKVKDYSKIINIPNYNLRFRQSEESNTITEEELNNIINIMLENNTYDYKTNFIFRYKNRYTCYDNNVVNGINLNIDMTRVLETKKFSNLNLKNKMNNEIEIEVVNNNVKITDKTAKLIYNRMFNIISVIQQIQYESNIIISNDKKNEIFLKIGSYFGIDKGKVIKDIPGMNPITLQLTNFITDLKNKYIVSDKADGRGIFLFIYDNMFFFVNKGTAEIIGYKDDSYNLTNYNETLIDCELIFMKDLNKYLCLAFDVVIYQGRAIKDEPSLKIRLQYLDKMIQQINNVKFSTIYDKLYNQVETKQNIILYINEYFNLMNTEIENKQFILMTKLFFIPSGTNNSEIFLYSKLIMEYYGLAKCPYERDGLIFTPLNQRYTNNSSFINNNIYKWKPPHLNTIDFYIEFEKNKENGEDLYVFNNIVNEKQAIKYNEEGADEYTEVDDTNITDIYKIANLYVNKVLNGIHTKIPFLLNKIPVKAHLPVRNGFVYDDNGDIIQSGTIIEFSYINNDNIVAEMRWKPLRIRYDKTDVVQKYEKKFGNSEMVAESNWRTIMEPIYLTDFEILSNTELYDKHLEELGKKVKVEDLALITKQKYYNTDSLDIDEYGRKFNNLVKDNLIYNYCSNLTFSNNSTYRTKVLDMGIGVGGDILKYYEARIGTLVAFDPDRSNLFDNESDSARSRFERNIKRKYKDYYKFYIFQGDGKKKLNYNDQKNDKTSDEEKDIIIRYFGETDKSKVNPFFDVISCQFMIHYLFDTEQSFLNYCSNVNKFLVPGGYVIITTLDGEYLHKLLTKNNGVYEDYYDIDGVKELFFKIEKIYKEEDINQFGLGINYYNAKLTTSESRLEYIVSPQLLIHYMEKFANVKLLETSSFENFYKKNFHFFQNTTEYEMKSKRFFENIKYIYTNTHEFNVKSGLNSSFLYRYYVFRKN